MRALLRRLRGDQRGITLVELLVAMLVTSLLLTLVGSFFVSISKAQRTVSSVNDSTRQGTTSMTQLSRYLREASRWQVSKTVSAPAFVSATGRSVQFYSGVDLSSARAGLTKVTVDVVSNRLRMQLQRGDCPAGGYCTFTGATRTLWLADVVRAGTLFSYVNADDGPVSAPANATYDTIRSVRVALTVGSTGGVTVNDSTFQATINLRNLDYGAATES